MPDDLDISEGPTDTHVFLAVVSEEVYEHARVGLDEEFGHPKGGTLTCISPVAEARKDAQGRPLVAMLNEHAAWPEVHGAIADFVGMGLAEFITREEWDAAAPPVWSDPEEGDEL